MARNVARKDGDEHLRSIFLAKWRERWRERAVTSVMVYIISPRGEISGEKDVLSWKTGAQVLGEWWMPAMRRLHKPVSVCWRAFLLIKG